MDSVKREAFLAGLRRLKRIQAAVLNNPRHQADTVVMAMAVFSALATVGMMEELAGREFPALQRPLIGMLALLITTVPTGANLYEN